jgi:hypothetical protein
MGPLRALVAVLRMVAAALAFGWIDALRQLCARLREIVVRICRRRRLPGRLRKTPLSRCVPISDPAYKRPDPLIYDQYYLMSSGLAVTWDNPDIQVLRGGLAVSSQALLPDTDYEVVARIWNGSTEAPVVGLPVMFSYLSFGIGTTSHPIAATVVDLGVKGGPQHPAFASVPWRTPQAAGHFCLQASFTWADDVNPNNNLGQENVQVLTAQSPAAGAFALRNSLRRRASYRFEADAYAPPPRPPCSDRGAPLDLRRYRGRRSPDAIDRRPPGHDRAEHPLPDGWSIAFEPDRPVLEPGQEATIAVTVTPPAGFTGTQAINVHAFDGDGLAGGVTLKIRG